MERENLKGEKKEKYTSPKLKDLGKVGQVTNTTGPGSNIIYDGATGSNYTS